MGCFFNRRKSARDVQNETIKQLEERVKRIEQQSILVQPANKATIESMVEALVSQNKPTDNFWSLLDKWNKLLAALTSISIVSAAVSVHIFLGNLNSRHLFASIISQPSVFLSVAVLFFVFLLIVSLSIYVPYILAYCIADGFLKNEVANKENTVSGRIKFYFILMISSILIQVFMVLSIIFDWDDNWMNQIRIIIIIYVLLPGLITLIGWCFTRKHFNGIKWYKWIAIALAYCFINVIYSFSILFALALSSNWFDNLTLHWWMAAFLVCNIFSLFFASSIAEFDRSLVNEGKSAEKKRMLVLPPFMILLLDLFMSVTSEGAKLEQHLFQNLGYIETSKQARWYLLDKRYTDWYLDSGKSKEKEVVPGQFSAASVELWRNKFFPNPFQSPNVLYGYKSVVKIPDPISLRYPNALYGYMAWNLGDIKIFCPVSVGLGKQVADKCLYIKGEYLQPLPTDL